MILAIDTSGSSLAIALAAGDGALLREFRAEATAEERGIHDTRLAREVANLLQAEGLAPNDITRIGVIIGPGSFTGLRIGLSFAKGFAYATNAAIVPLTQHEVIAASGVEGLIVTAGYREDLFYAAESTSPRDIALVSREELPSSFTIHPSSLSSLVKLTAAASQLDSGVAQDVLEPLYITEFTVGLRK
jgi:tRNA threonylcarbamoyl adenosine modification protein YeaZ